MKPNSQRLQFATGTLARRAVEEWVQIPGLSVKILHGRIGPDTSTLDVEIGGAPDSLQAFKRWNDARVACPSPMLN